MNVGGQALKLATQPSLISQLWPSHHRSLGPNWNSRAGRHSPPILVTENWSVSRRSSLKSRSLNPFLPPSILPELDRTTNRFLLLTPPTSISDHPQPPMKPICSQLAVGRFTTLGTRSGAVAMRGWSPPIPLDSSQPKVYIPSFLDIRSYFGHHEWRGQFGNFWF